MCAYTYSLRGVRETVGACIRKCTFKYVNVPWCICVRECIAIYISMRVMLVRACVSAKSNFVYECEYMYMQVCVYVYECVSI